MNKYICEVCNNEFDNQYEFAQHCLKCHKEMQEKKEKELKEKAIADITYLIKEASNKIDEYFSKYNDSLVIPMGDSKDITFNKGFSPRLATKGHISRIWDSLLDW